MRVSGKDSGWFSINSGVRQGCMACKKYQPLDKRDIHAQLMTMHHLSNLEYATTPPCWHPLPRSSARRWDIYHQEASKLSLKVVWSKMKAMHIGDSPDPPPPLCVGTDEVEFVSSFTYLGSIITHTGDLRPEIDLREGLAAGVMNTLLRPLWHPPLNLPTQQVSRLQCLSPFCPSVWC